MTDPDFTLTPKAGEETRVTLIGQETPWWIKIAGYDLYVVVKCDETPVELEPVVGEEDIHQELRQPEGTF